MLDNPSSITPVPTAHPARQLIRPVIVIALVGAAVAAVGIVSRGQSERRAAADSAALGTQATVSTVVVTPEGGTSDLTLPARIEAFNAAQIYARANGYVRRWLVDIGDHVRAGQTLAIIDAPDVQQQLAQAQADYQTARANRDLAATTAARWQALRAHDAVSQQETDEKLSDLRAKTTIEHGAQANVRRLSVQQDFARLRAPFAGTITSRTAQIGALIVAQSTTAQPLFTVSDASRVRVYVQVPQLQSAQVHPGAAATIHVPEYPSRDFPLTVRRTAGALDPASGAMQIELIADNRDGALKPGAYGQVHFALGGTGATLKVPSRALIFRGGASTVATVDAQGRVTIVPVTIGTDDGKTVEVLKGLQPGVRVIDTPPDALATGDKVRVLPTKPEKAAAHGG